MPLAFGISGGLATGRNPGSSISSEYESPFPFQGVIHEVVVDVSGEHLLDKEAQMKIAMAHQ
jgi:arylsulfatase